MGLFNSKPDNERLIQEEREQRQKPTRLLLYGPGESGKTTLLRQMKLAARRQAIESLRLKQAMAEENNKSNVSKQKKKKKPMILRLLTGANTTTEEKKTKDTTEDKSVLNPKGKLNKLIVGNVIEGVAQTLQAKRLASGGRIRFAQESPETRVIETYTRWNNMSKNPKTTAKNNSSQHLHPRKVNNNSSGNLKNGSQIDTPGVLTPELRNDILYVSKTELFQECLRERFKYQIVDSWEYFIGKLESNPDWGTIAWIPSDEEVLHARIRTTGREVVPFEMDNSPFEMIDVGGQKAERTKFFHLFSSIDAVCFVASMSEYDQYLFEDNTSKRFADTIQLWTNTINSERFGKAFFLLFLNKVDLFRQKFYYNKKKIEVDFEHDAGPPPLPSDEEDENCDKALQWYSDLYKSRVKDENKRDFGIRIYHITALDAQNVEKIMDFCGTFLLHRGIGAS